MGFASRTGLLAGAAVALALTGAQAALAATTVSGAGDSSSPLVIDPRTSPSDALQLRLNVGSPAPVAFVERMPVTKTIQDVSLGDFQSDPGDCANPMQLYLMVREHPAGDADQATQIAYAPAQPTVPDSAGVMTWRLDQPVTLQQGRGYSFAIMSTDPASCHFLYQTTWAHNGAQVEGGTNQCATGVRFGENDSVLLKRGWHTQGVSDGVYGPNGCAGSKWDPGLSEGWLVSIPSGDAWDVATAAIAQGLPVPPPPPDSCTVNDNHLHPDYGAEQLHYYPVNYPPGPVSYDYYLCRWTQFAPPGHEIPDGWYYGLPWRTERGGAPRDVYVQLGKDTTPAPVKFAPILRFDTSEKWRPLNVNAFFAEGVHKVCMAKPPATRDTAKQAVLLRLPTGVRRFHALLRLSHELRSGKRSGATHEPALEQQPGVDPGGRQGVAGVELPLNRPKLSPGWTPRLWNRSTLGDLLPREHACVGRPV